MTPNNVPEMASENWAEVQWEPKRSAFLELRLWRKDL